jgi:hypothetical protein
MGAYLRYIRLRTYRRVIIPAGAEEKATHQTRQYADCLSMRQPKVDRHYSLSSRQEALAPRLV